MLIAHLLHSIIKAIFSVIFVASAGSRLLGGHKALKLAVGGHSHLLLGLCLLGEEVGVQTGLLHPPRGDMVPPTTIMVVLRAVIPGKVAVQRPQVDYRLVAVQQQDVWLKIFVSEMSGNIF